MSSASNVTACTGTRRWANVRRPMTCACHSRASRAQSALSAPQDSKPILENSQKSMGMIPNLHGVLSEAPQTLKAYGTLHELFTNTSFNNDEITVVWQTINVEHECAYCVPVHTAIAKRGNLDKADLDAFFNAGYGQQQVLEVILGLAQKTISNYVNRIAETPLDDPFQPLACRQALDFAFQSSGRTLDADTADTLLQAYQCLPAFGDAVPALEALKPYYRLFAFSNGTPEAVERVLQNAGVRNYLEGVVSVHELGTFKPDPAVYEHARNVTEAGTAPLWLVSGNPWDVIGARSAGLEAAWVQRAPGAVFDPWDIDPSLVIQDLTELTERLPVANASKG